MGYEDPPSGVILDDGVYYNKYMAGNKIKMSQPLMSGAVEYIDGPFSSLTTVECNGRVLRGPDNTYYIGDGSTYTYGVVSGLDDDSTVDPAKTITNQNQVEVFVNGTPQPSSFIRV